MSTLPDKLRRALETAAGQARKIAESGARKALEALALHEPDPYRTMDVAQRALRKKLRAQARQLGDGESQTRPGVYEIRHLVEKLAYDQWHRLLFARFLLENNLLISPEHEVSVTLEDCEELAPSLGLKDAWTVAARFAAVELPEIFRADDPAGAVELPLEDRKPLIQLVTDLPVEVFTASDSLGWCYQFWQAARKEEVNKSGNKIGADELPAVTQLFTEDYMVDFLLDNTLGGWWAGKKLTTDFTDGTDFSTEEECRQAIALPGCEWRYLRFIQTADPDSPSVTSVKSVVRKWLPAAGTFDGWPKTSKELKCFDPCMGSGHFIVALFERLVALRMAEESLDEAAAVAAVIRDNLFGLEIDPRCAQIAAFNLALAAWRRVGHCKLPAMNMACTGIGPQAAEEEWLKLAEQSGHKMNVLSREPILNGLRNLHELFSNAPTLGSLIDPNQLSADLLTADYETLLPFLSAALEAERDSVVRRSASQTHDAERRATLDEAAHERAVAAAGMVKAAELLAGDYTLVITNVPYLGRGKQDDTLKQHLEQHYPHSKADLATAFNERCLEFCAKDGTTALVTPQNWLFLSGYTKLRESLLTKHTWNLVARLGPNAFRDMNWWAATTSLIVVSAGCADDTWKMSGIDASADKEPASKAVLLRGEIRSEIAVIDQSAQIKNAQSRVLFTTDSEISLLFTVADFANGLQTGDAVRYVRFHWEPTINDVAWRYFQSTVDATSLYSGCEQVIRWEYNGSDISQEQPGAAIRGIAAWGNPGIAVSAMNELKVTLYLGELYDDNTVVILPKSPDVLTAIWCFCSSPDYAPMVRQIDQALKVRRALIEIPFDLAHWQQVAAEKYPDGLPEPESDDPTQWLFHGRPESSTAPLQVAVARLLGYRWPAEVETHSIEPRPSGSGSETDGPTQTLPDGRGSEGMRISQRARELVRRCDELLPFADADGIVCLSASKGEAPAAERLRALLSQALGPFDVRALLANAGPKGSKSETLEDWLRDEFFEQHCALFHHRPFIWHIWDGHKSGFSALVNYHKLDHALLEKLTYAYLGDWIRRQQAAVDAGEGGSDARLAAARLLQSRLKLILEGEPPYDIFVRWKPLSQQAIGWHPDLNDGVRMNIRPFLAADIPGGKKGAGILRAKPNIKWEKDRGKEPQRDKAEFPWFWNGSTFTGDRLNNIHLTREQKQGARK